MSGKDKSSPESLSPPTCEWESDVDSKYAGFKNITSDSTKPSDTIGKTMKSIRKWANELPDTFKNISDRDIHKLIEPVWLEIFLLTWLYSDRLTEEWQTHLRNTANEDLVKKLDDLADKINNLKMDKYEFNCLRSVILFKMDTSISPTDEYEEYQEQSHLLLSRYICEKYPDSPSRYGKELMLLSRLHAFKTTSSIQECIFPDDFDFLQNFDNLQEHNRLPTLENDSEPTSAKQSCHNIFSIVPTSEMDDNTKSNLSGEKYLMKETNASLMGNSQSPATAVHVKAET